MSSPRGYPGGEVDDFRPTHVVPQEGLPAWEGPDVTRPTVPLDPFLPVQLLSRRGEWGEVLCANGWSAWVDGRLLVAVPRPPPTTGGGNPVRSEDPRPLLTRGSEALERYRRAVDELASGRIDTDAFRRSVRGLRAGVVIDGESVWLYDERSGRWLYDDGDRMTTYAVVAGPGGPAPPERAPEPAPEPPPTDADPGGVAAVRRERTPTDAVAVPREGPGERPDGAAAHDPTRIVETRDPGGD
ncbi:MULTISPECIES: hypothetical protein [Streptomyces]|uniref:Uncharacterized protein n=1 Tax=Streptomyces spororaveus TaxID=284039 RepID=A0ABQ3TN31_9ACTN|nr:MULTISPECIES: hypothetical protein [Streptomyces]MCM9077808.1 hypothetical protein [Streptomyces spororaveus]MCX5307713.1 hypothetical protein [Streptomyces sp. NBC_00160]GHI81844.1 hypothetical protein Sspor_74050 [Streptomyces spororaveus]